MAEFWDLIVRSNTFNFIVMLAIFAVVWQKLNISNAIEKMKTEIAEFIENSKLERETSEKHLADTKKSVENLDAEIKEVIEKSKVSAQNVFDEIQEMAKKSVEKIEANVDKILDNEERKVNTRLSQTTAASAITLASERLKKMFDESPELHEAHINEAINALEGIKF